MLDKITFVILRYYHSIAVSVVFLYLNPVRRKISGGLPTTLKAYYTKEVAMKKPLKGRTEVPLARKEEAMAKEESTKETDVKASQRETRTVTGEGDMSMEAKTGLAGFDMTSVSADVLKTIKFSHDTTIDMITKIYELNEKVVKDVVEVNKQIQQDTENMLGELIRSGMRGWNEYRKVSEEGYRNVESLLQSQK